MRGDLKQLQGRPVRPSKLRAPVNRGSFLQPRAQRFGLERIAYAARFNQPKASGASADCIADPRPGVPSRISS